MAYNITTINNSSAVTLVTNEVQTVADNSNGYVCIEVTDADFEKIIVEDNGVDVTEQLTDGININRSENTVLGTYTLVSGGFNSGGANYFQGIVGKGVDASQTTSNYYSNGSGNITVFTYNLGFSIPQGSTITNLYCQVNGHPESTSNSSEYMCVQLRSGNVELSSEYNFKSSNTTNNTTYTLTASTIPTSSQLENLVLYCRLGYYGGAINGATCYVEYNYVDTTDCKTYAIASISADHTVVIYEITPPPEEDPEKTYYPITISNINATTSPYTSGTTRVESGTTETIVIAPTDPLLTLAMDNGVDITSQLVFHGGAQPSYTVSARDDASYGFSLNSNNYYESGNYHQSSSYAICRVNITCAVKCLVTFSYINYAESTYDYGLFGNIDTALNLNNSADSNVKLNLSGEQSADAKTLTYEVESGTHFIDIKFIKDGSVDNNNDSLQFKIDSIQELETNQYYEYTLTNINEAHSLIFIFGEVTYYFVNSNGSSDLKLFPDGQMVQLPGDNYKVTIIPNDNSSVITATDNGTDVTSQLERKEVTSEKDGETITVVNYTYRINNVQATHDIVISSTSGYKPSFVKDTTWKNTSDMLKKNNDRWNSIKYTRIWVYNGSAWIENAQRTITTNGMIFGGVINNSGGE